MNTRDFYRSQIRKALCRLETAIKADPLPEVCETHLSYLKLLAEEATRPEPLVVAKLQAQVDGLTAELKHLKTLLQPIIAREGVLQIKAARLGDTL